MAGRKMLALCLSALLLAASSGCGRPEAASAASAAVSPVASGKPEPSSIATSAEDLNPAGGSDYPFPVGQIANLIL